MVSLFDMKEARESPDTVGKLAEARINRGVRLRVLLKILAAIFCSQKRTPSDSIDSNITISYKRGQKLGAVPKFSPRRC